MPVLVDSNVILDLVSEDPVWLDWSKNALVEHAGSGLLTNAMIYAELCCNSDSPEEVDALLGEMEIG